MNKFKNAAILILRESKSPLHYKDITKRAIEKGILETDGATPEQSMNSQLGIDIKYGGNNSDFIRPARGIFALNPKKEETPTKKTKKIQEELQEKEEEKIKIDSSFIGKGGEHLVCSELLFRGYNASIMSVDTGMDITATKDGKLFSIQVKTANVNQFNTYNFDVRKVSFEKSYQGNIFYIFILKSVKDTKYLILPLYEMEKKVHEKAIKYISTPEKYRVKIDIRDDKVYLGNRQHEMSYYLNKWDIIK
jgi:CRISPR/Cas system-associated exonuclease Cas4 (RecB family)